MENKEVFSRFLGFEEKFNQVIHLITLKQLRKDLDDGLLEKLLSFLQVELTNEELLYLVNSTSLLKLFTLTLESLKSNHEDCCPHLSSFSLRAFGICLKSPDVFEVFEKEKTCLSCLVSVVKSGICVSLLPSCHAAILICAQSFTLHSNGRKFLTQNGVIDMFIPSLSASSYYVRKEAISFFASYLENAVHLKDNLEMDVNDLNKKIISIIVAPETTRILNDSCSSVLKICFDESSHLPSLLVEQHQLLQRIHRKIENGFCPSNSMIQLIAACLVYKKNTSECETLHLLIKNGFYSEAVVLSTEIVLRNQRTQDVEDMSLSVLHTVLWPVVVVLDDDHVDDCISSDCYKIREDKTTCISVLCASLSALVKLAPLLHSEVLLLVVMMTTKLLRGLYYGCSELPSCLSASRNTKLISLLVEVFGSIFTETDILKFSRKIDLLVQSWMTILRDLFNCNMICQVLKLIGIVIKRSDDDLWLNNAVETAGFSETLERKLFDPQWPIVDSSLEILVEIVEKLQRGTQFWENFLKEKKFHTIVCNLAFMSEADGYVRASAISVITAMYFCPCLLKDLEQDLHVTKMQTISKLCELSDHADVFIQRESLNSLTRWLSDKEHTHHSKIHEILSNTVQYSFDYQSKILALTAWLSICKTSWTSKEDCFESLNYYCRIGFGHSLRCAVKDSDNAVQTEAIHILMRMRQSMSHLDLNEASLKCDDNSYDNSETSNTFDEISCPVFSEEERDNGINDVLNMETTNQICDIIKERDPDTTTLSQRRRQSYDCSLKLLWKVLWSKENEILLKNCSASSDLYALNPCMLLDDIAAAEIPAEDKCDMVYPDIDCY